MCSGCRRTQKAPKICQNCQGKKEGTSGQTQIRGSLTPWADPRLVIPPCDLAGTARHPVQTKTFSSLDAPGWLKSHLPKSRFPFPLLEDVRNNGEQSSAVKTPCAMGGSCLFGHPLPALGAAGGSVGDTHHGDKRFTGAAVIQKQAQATSGTCSNHSLQVVLCP